MHNKNSVVYYATNVGDLITIIFSSGTSAEKNKGKEHPENRL